MKLLDENQIYCINIYEMEFFSMTLDDAVTFYYIVGKVSILLLSFYFSKHLKCSFICILCTLNVCSKKNVFFFSFLNLIWIFFGR